MFTDTHCHLFKEYYDNIDKILENAKENNVTKIIVSGCDMKSNIEVLELVKKYDMIYGSLGFHPTELDGIKENDLIWLDKNINQEKIIAVGEIGLDYHYDNTDKEKQIMMFKEQIKIANKHNKPIIVHSRDSIQETYNIIKDTKTRGVIHCYSGSIEMAKKINKLGFYLGIGGISTYKNANNIIEVIKKTDLEYILLETDSPYLSPEPKRKERNESANIQLIANKISEIKGIKTKDLAVIVNNNVRSLFDI